MTQWIGIALTIVGFIVTAAVLWGKFSARMDNTDKLLDKHAEYHKDHYTHASDLQRHWTERERDTLTDKIHEMSADLKELLKRNGGSNGNV